MIVKKIEEKGEPSMWETGTWVCTLPRTQNNSFSPPKELNSYAIKKKKMASQKQVSKSWAIKNVHEWKNSRATSETHYKEYSK